MISWSRKRKQQNTGIPNASNRINITEQNMPMLIILAIPNALKISLQIPYIGIAKKEVQSHSPVVTYIQFGSGSDFASHIFMV